MSRPTPAAAPRTSAVVRITTDAGIGGIGVRDTNPWAVKALIDAPDTHCMGLGFKDMLIYALLPLGLLTILRSSDSSDTSFPDMISCSVMRAKRISPSSARFRSY